MSEKHFLVLAWIDPRDMEELTFDSEKEMQAYIDENDYVHNHFVVYEIVPGGARFEHTGEKEYPDEQEEEE